MSCEDSGGPSGPVQPKIKVKLGRTSVHDEMIPTMVPDKNGKEKPGYICKHCNFVFRTRNPTNVRSHLETFHKAVYDESKGNSNYYYY